MKNKNFRSILCVVLLLAVLLSCSIGLAADLAEGETQSNVSIEEGTVPEISETTEDVALLEMQHEEVLELTEAQKFPVGKSCLIPTTLDYIMDEYTHLTGLEKEEVQTLFSEIKDKGFTVEQRNNTLSSSSLNAVAKTTLEDADIIIEIQSNYADIVKNLSADELRDLQKYLLYYALEYYEPMSKDIALFEEYVKNAPSSDYAPIADSVPTENVQPSAVLKQDINSKVVETPVQNSTKSSSRRVGHLQLYSGGGTNSSSSTRGHSWLQVTNTSSSVISVGNGTIGPNKASQYGTWQRNEHTGLYYNMEGYHRAVNPNSMKGYVCIQVGLTSYWQGVLSTFIKNNDAWSYTNNCSSFASKAWNQVCSTKVYAGLVPTPAYLSTSIKNVGSYATNLPFYRYYYTYYAQGANGTPKMSIYN